MINFARSILAKNDKVPNIPAKEQHDAKEELGPAKQIKSLKNTDKKECNSENSEELSDKNLKTPEKVQAEK